MAVLLRLVLEVTGVSMGGAATHGDYATIAYDAATGAQQWASRYNGTGDNGDVGSAIAVSSSGAAVVVTGVSVPATPENGYAAVSYNAETGAQQWASFASRQITNASVPHAVLVASARPAARSTSSATGTTTAPATTTSPPPTIRRPALSYGPAVTAARAPRGCVPLRRILGGPPGECRERTPGRSAIGGGSPVADEPPTCDGGSRTPWRTRSERCG